MLEVSEDRILVERGLVSALNKHPVLTRPHFAFCAMHCVLSRPLPLFNSIRVSARSWLPLKRASRRDTNVAARPSPSFTRLFSASQILPAHNKIDLNSPKYVTE